MESQLANFECESKFGEQILAYVDYRRKISEYNDAWYSAVKKEYGTNLQREDAIKRISTAREAYAKKMKGSQCITILKVNEVKNRYEDPRFGDDIEVSGKEIISNNDVECVFSVSQKAELLSVNRSDLIFVQAFEIPSEKVLKHCRILLGQGRECAERACLKLLENELKDYKICGSESILNDIEHNRIDANHVNRSDEYRQLHACYDGKLKDQGLTELIFAHPSSDVYCLALSRISGGVIRINYNSQNGCFDLPPSLEKKIAEELIKTRVQISNL